MFWGEYTGACFWAILLSASHTASCTEPGIQLLLTLLRQPKVHSATGASEPMSKSTLEAA